MFVGTSIPLIPYVYLTAINYISNMKKYYPLIYSNFKFFFFVLLIMFSIGHSTKAQCVVPNCSTTLVIDDFTTPTTQLRVNRTQNLLTAFESTTAPEALCGIRDVYMVLDPNGFTNVFAGVDIGMFYNDEAINGDASYYITYDGTNGSNNEIPDATIGLGGINLSGRQFKFYMQHDMNVGEGTIDFYVRVWSSPTQMSYTSVTVDYATNSTVIAFPTTMTPVSGGGADMTSIKAIQIYVDTKGLPNGAVDFSIMNFISECIPTPCTAVTGANITLNPISPVVAGTTVNLTANKTDAGTPTTYTWASSPNTGFTSTTNQATLTNPTAGTYNFTVTVQNTSGTGNCTATATSSLSVSPSCAINATITQSICNNNGTPTTIPKAITDDYFNVTITATNETSMGMYEIVLAGDVIGTGIYGTNVVISGVGGIFKADGSTTYTLMIRDQTTNTCNTTKTTTPVAHCSKVCPPQLCPIVTGVKN
jgi:PKD domain